ncbi:MAG: hypothetical protein MSA61_10625 [Coriobacteriaceae bacterium]|uniref:hypothetical protein n=1 Tax=Tractidigestivibacter sp. TaxID=2847320 RepID=UPI002A80E091|nr:hypothetical protein [Tractidigestivibacter sp.]MCI6273787.1 hypothetical protein [Coriobacteriaceae bacterium]MCI7439660.1 hypothetical protein [Coriobacteriaceae bacterium]MDD7585116.1 hypothetical protein [Coriobacteriaceae bacterium]MDY4534889.1 hypothetical protein [Tractidigestivibacter sp.]MDY5272057.1 hypothetical protein [Tractidigestivibacter sp.]
MRPLNYAMLKYFTTVGEAGVDDVMDALKGDYAGFTAFKRDKMQEALMTAEKNGLIGESRVDLDGNGGLRVFYTATPEQRDTINSYIK